MAQQTIPNERCPSISAGARRRHGFTDFRPSAAYVRRIFSSVAAAPTDSTHCGISRSAGGQFVDVQTRRHWRILYGYGRRQMQAAGMVPLFSMRSPNLGHLSNAQQREIPNHERQI